MIKVCFAKARLRWMSLDFTLSLLHIYASIADITCSQSRGILTDISEREHGSLGVKTSRWTTRRIGSDKSSQQDTSSNNESLTRVQVDGLSKHWRDSANGDEFNDRIN